MDGYCARLALVTSQTEAIESVQRRYIEALEKKLAVVEEELAIRRDGIVSKMPEPNLGSNDEHLNKTVNEGLSQPARQQNILASNGAFHTTNIENGGVDQTTQTKDSARDNTLGGNLKAEQGEPSQPNQWDTDAQNATGSSPGSGNDLIHVKSGESSREQPDVPIWPNVRFQEGRWKGEEQVVNDIPAEEAEAAPAKSSDKAITCLKKYDSDDRYKYTQLEIHGKDLKALMQTALAHRPYLGLDLEPDSAIIILSPYEVLIHNWTYLEALAGEDDELSAVKEFKARLDHINSLSTSSASAASATAQWPANVREFAKGQGVKRARQQLRELLGVAKLEPKELKTYFAEVKDLSKDMISYDHLWTIFRPGDVVVAETVFKEKQLFIVNYSESTAQSLDNVNKSWPLVCWAYDFDGIKFKRIAVRFEIAWFKAARAITNLPVYPIRYLGEKQKELETRLQNRGKRFRELCLMPSHNRLFEYSSVDNKRDNPNMDLSNNSSEHTKSGTTTTLQHHKAIDHGLSLTAQQPSPWNLQSLYDIGKEKKLNLNTVQIKDGDPVMVDFEMFMLHRPSLGSSPSPFMGDLQYSEDYEECYCNICRANTIYRDNQKIDYDTELDMAREFTSLQYQMCPPRVLGFHLRDKRWVELDVRYINPTQGKNIEDAWRQLEIPQEHKVLIRELVQSHTSGRRNKENIYMEDLTKGKGEGLVIMLYGPPGVGKTLTAESVARATRKPLLQISASDIGTLSGDVEKNMKTLFHLASHWQAVLLLDEADVFLEARSEKNWERNTTVSALLRILEYYNGILILTSNRLKSVDHAMLSRIHLAIKYDVLDEIQKTKIFKNLIEQLSPDEIEKQDEIMAWVDTYDTKRLFKILNGRQIRNILFSAATLASGREENRKLRKEDILKLTKSTSEFASDLKNVMEIFRTRAEPGFQPENGYT